MDVPAHSKIILFDFNYLRVIFFEPIDEAVRLSDCGDLFSDNMGNLILLVGGLN